MYKIIDNIIDKITMYRLVLYYLIALWVLAFILSLFGALPYQPIPLIFEPVFLIVVCWVSNKILAKIFDAPTNVESLYITALILTLIITPPTSSLDVASLFWAGLLAMASKYIFAIGKKHLFNPVAVSVFLTSLVLGQSASWWVGNAYMAPLVVLGGLIIMRKTQRTDMVFWFVIVALITVFSFAISKNSDVLITLRQVTLHSSMFFLAFAMLTEPYTLPPTRNLQIIYAAIIGFLFSPDIHIGSYYFTPETALLVGNFFAYIVSPKIKLILNLSQKFRSASDIMDFIFNLSQKINFIPGQYMEFTLQHYAPDSRGTRRYFTLANSPTEDNMRLGVKFYENGSSYKMAMLAMNQKNRIVGAQLSGDFVMPKDPKQKLAFFAGGIGITPFRSMIKYLIDTNERRDLVMFYINKNFADIAYSDVFNEAYSKLGIRTIYTLTDIETIPENWQGYTGRIDAEIIKKKIPDFDERIFYISGPHNMVEAYKQTLVQMGINKNQIKTDFFPGLA